MLQAYEARNLRPVRAGTSLALSDITGEASRLAAFDAHERVWLGRDEARGLTAIVAIHDTTLGPALGGTRIWAHENLEAALTDVLRLSRGMTYKAAVAGLALGGGKAIIRADPRSEKTPELLEAYAEMLAMLGGQFYTAEDVGMTLADADFLRARTFNVGGTTQGGSGNPSPVTAHGVFLGIRAALAHRFGTDALAGRRIAVQGLGSVGFALCEALHAGGARLVVADLDAARIEKARDAFAAEIVATGDFASADVDVLAPCALGGGINAQTVPLIRAKVVAGAANNQLARHEDARMLMERGILYAPDYVINAGGLINVAAEFDPEGYDRERALAKVGEIPRTLADIFSRSQARGLPTNDVAQEIAGERIAAAGRTVSG